VLGNLPDEAKKLRAAYDDWWERILPRLENEEAVGPKTNPYHDLYYQQYGRVQIGK
jgi:arylsulfatase